MKLKENQKKMSGMQPQNAAQKKSETKHCSTKKKIKHE